MNHTHPILSAPTDDDTARELAAKLDYPEPLDWHAVIGSQRRDREWSARLRLRSDVTLRHLTELAAMLKPHRPTWRTDRDEQAQLIQDIDALQREQDALQAHAATTEPWITVSELATAIGRTISTTRKLLDQGSIPGAVRKTPGVKNSPWLIPASSPTLFLEGRS